ncbi:divergent polysaccharide deacetylase family protein [Haematospirillum sp. H1815]|uniref:divergent polysaccharide deacetylase family protein n=1 Tax=Haematospirillum sp. H1815 TaxID=2723108 RepID=UPI001439ED2F|nr:divergent polysaccharide deacetylase family protein [Haematospirillum sp. H1815]NKD76540.1 divergent polysaccharide deacetylase family protein [Haematospirillum sp. H1815]
MSGHLSFFRSLDKISRRPAIFGGMVAVILVLAVVIGLVIGHIYRSASPVFLAAQGSDPIGVMADNITHGRDPLFAERADAPLQGVSPLAEPEAYSDQWRSAPREASPKPSPNTSAADSAVVPLLPVPHSVKEKAALPQTRKPEVKTASLPPGSSYPALPHSTVFVAIVIDDMGVDQVRSRRVIDLPGPLTTSFLTFAHDLKHQARSAAAAGHELMMHMPMEPKGKVSPGPDALLVRMGKEEIASRVHNMLDRMEDYVGINNHQGSKFTENEAGLKVVMTALKQRRLFFLDSRTSGQSVGGRIAEEEGVRTIDRDIFLDHENRPGYVEKQLALTEDLAKRRGYAIAIGHPRDATIGALRRWLPTLSSKGIALVPVSTLIDMRYGTPAADLIKPKRAGNG